MNANDLMKKSFIELDSEETLSKLIGKFIKSKRADALITKSGKYFGTVSRRKLLRSRIDASSEKAGKSAVRTSVLRGKEPAEEIARLMLNSDTHMLPVVKSGEVLGAVYASDVLDSISVNFEGMNASDFASKKIVAFEHHTDLGKVMKIMREKKISHAPVTNKHNKLMGIVSIFDIFVKHSLFPEKRPGGHNRNAILSSPGKSGSTLNLPVTDFAEFDVVTGFMYDSAESIIKKMKKNQISDVVIIDEQSRPVGIVTIRDFLKFFA